MNMCGIVGYVGKRKASEVLVDCLKKLEYRGYDSWGVATIGGGNLNLVKEVGMIERVEHIELEGDIGIGHTRWATHGKVEKRNAHPHIDCSGKIALVHNGIISNFEELRQELRSRHNFLSDTDTECLAHLIEENYNGDLEEAFKKALKRVKGTYAVAVICKEEPDKILCARKESPLLLGVGRGEMFIGSDISSFLKFTNKAVALDDGEYAIIDKNGFVVKDLEYGNKIDKEIIEITWSPEVAEKQGFEHFMLKEIHEQPQTITNALNIYPGDIKRLAEMIEASEKVYLTGAGTSLHACIVAEYWFAKICRKPVVALDSSELQEKAVIDKDTLAIGVTQSGETYDTLAAMKYAKRRGARIGAIVNVIGSTATRLADHVIMQASGIEIAVCATKTYTSQLVVLLRVAIELAKIRGIDVGGLEKEISYLPSLIREVLNQKDKIRDISSKLTTRNYLFIGRGINLPSALEAALKFKEITYLHAEGMSGGMLKHGTISLIDEDMYTVAMIPAEGENRSKMKSNIQEVKSRGGPVLGIISGENLAECDESILIPTCNELISPIVFAPAYQLLAYYKAVELGRNVDKPRALAKSVTVE